jgi:hypothetical protein
MLTSQALIEDMLFLRKYYDWSDADFAEIKDALQENAALARYFNVLAVAHRAGYRQNADNGFIRLRVWCIEKNFPDPFTPDVDLALFLSDDRRDHHN